MKPALYFYTNADTEIIAAEQALLTVDLPFEVRCVKLDASPMPEGAQVVIFRRLGDLSGFEEEFSRIREFCARKKIAMVVVAGERRRDPAIEALSTAPLDVVSETAKRLFAGGALELRELFKFLANRYFGSSFALKGVSTTRPFKVIESFRHATGPACAIVMYQAHEGAQSDAHVKALVSALKSRGIATGVASVYSLRDQNAQRALRNWIKRNNVKLLISLVWAAGKEGREGWETPHKEGVPVLQAIASSRSFSQWQESESGLSPIDVAVQVALPEFDGRIITVPFAFKESFEAGKTAAELSGYRIEGGRLERIADLAASYLQLSAPPGSKRLAIVVNAYPTRASRLGNAVGLDSGASLVALLSALKQRGWQVNPFPEDPAELMGMLASGYSYDEGILDPSLVRCAGRLPVKAYSRHFKQMPSSLKARMIKVWGEPPGEVFVLEDSFVFPGLDLGAVKVFIQPPRSVMDKDLFSAYHSPDIPPTHHYMAFYQYLREEFRAHALIQLGKHGTLEWLPGKSVGLSEECFPDAALKDIPLVYPFVVNDPGEGIQAKRRAHAVIIDHLPPPVAQAGLYEQLAEIEALMDECARVASLDPTKVPMVKERLFNALRKARLDAELGLQDWQDLDEILLHVDGYLCEIKDLQIRTGLHVLGQSPNKEKAVDYIARILRAIKPGWLEDQASPKTQLRTAAVDSLQKKERQIIERVLEGKPAAGLEKEIVSLIRDVDRRLKAACQEMENLLKALDGGFVPPGPAGAPTRGALHVLPTGRNFYSLDPRAVPTRFAYEVGKRLAQGFLERFLRERGSYPRSCAVVVWGTSCMRTGGDDLGQALALVGAEPIYDEKTQRVIGFKPVALSELGRPRVDVTLRISGFFRDAFRDVIVAFDRLCGEIAELDEPPELNPLKEFGTSPRIFGPPPGGYGSGIYQAIEVGQWEDRADLAEIFLRFSSFSYSETSYGVPAEGLLSSRLALAEAAIKNQDNREHDLFDSDDYFQEHGGLIAAIATLSKKEPLAVFADSSTPESPKVRLLKEEALAVLRARVLNPRWLEGIKEHSYKGAAEIVATIDYAFGYDALVKVLEDWCYEEMAKKLVLDESMKEFFRRSNPWALRDAAERLLEAYSRGLWREPDPGTLAALQEAVAEAEAWLE